MIPTQTDRPSSRLGPDRGDSAARNRRSDYGELKRLIERHGLLDKQVAYYTCLMLLMLGLLVLGVAFLRVIDNVWLQLLNAALWAFVFGQIAFLGHDAAHRQVLHTRRQNDLLSLVLFNLLLGISRTWWVDKHNRHHAMPNQLELDPDIDLPVVAFSEEQARAKRGFPRFIVAYQAYLLVPLLLLEAFNLRFHSFRVLVRGKPEHRLAEGALVAIHFALYVGVLLSLLGAGQALLFIVAHHALAGLYLGSSFATNHKGMPVLAAGTQLDFLSRQVLTTRNLTAHPLTDFVFGPLGCQIEHHLFPTMARNKLREAAPIVKAFCQERGLPYHETSPLRAYREVFDHLRDVSAPLRAERRRANADGNP